MNETGVEKAKCYWINFEVKTICEWENITQVWDQNT